MLKKKKSNESIFQYYEILSKALSTIYLKLASCK